MCKVGAKVHPEDADFIIFVFLKQRGSRARMQYRKQPYAPTAMFSPLWFFAKDSNTSMLKQINKQLHVAFLYFCTSRSHFPSSCLAHNALASDFRTQDFFFVSVADETTAPPAGVLKQKHLRSHKPNWYIVLVQEVSTATRLVTRLQLCPTATGVFSGPPQNFIYSYLFFRLRIRLFFSPSILSFWRRWQFELVSVINEWRNVRWRLTGGPKEETMHPNWLRSALCCF